MCKGPTRSVRIGTFGCNLFSSVTWVGGGGCIFRSSLTGKKLGHKVRFLCSCFCFDYFCVFLTRFTARESSRREGYKWNNDKMIFPTIQQRSGRNMMAAAAAKTPFLIEACFISTEDNSCPLLLPPSLTPVTPVYCNPATLPSLSYLRPPPLSEVIRLGLSRAMIARGYICLLSNLLKYQRSITPSACCWLLFIPQRLPDIGRNNTPRWSDHPSAAPKQAIFQCMRRVIHIASSCCLSRRPSLRNNGVILAKEVR